MRRIRTVRVRCAVSFALGCALGCGGKASSDADMVQAPSAPPPASSSAPRPSPAPSPAPAVARPAPAVPAPPAVMPSPRVEVPQDLSEAELAKAQAENILLAYCGVCHGPALGDESFGAIGFINDLDQLIAAGYVVPRSSADSLLIQVMRNGSMPPRGSGAVAVPKGDIDVVARYIDNPRFWPVLLPTGGGDPLAAVDAGADAG